MWLHVKQRGGAFRRRAPYPKPYITLNMLWLFPISFPLSQYSPNIALKKPQYNPKIALIIIVQGALVFLAALFPAGHMSKSGHSRLHPNQGLGFRALGFKSFKGESGPCSSHESGKGVRLFSKPQ